LKSVHFPNLLAVKKFSLTKNLQFLHNFGSIGCFGCDGGIGCKGQDKPDEKHANKNIQILFI
jgi:hypothetical protein